MITVNNSLKNNVQNNLQINKIYDRARASTIIWDIVSNNIRINIKHSIVSYTLYILWNVYDNNEIKAIKVNNKQLEDAWNKI